MQSPHYDYGKLLVDALPAIYTRPTQVVGPALMIVLTILAAMLVGDGLAAAADPRSSGGRRGGRRGAAPGARSAEVAREEDDLVVVEDLRVSTTDGKELVHGVSFRIRRGEIVGVVGESGSGKSLTAMSLARLLADGLESSAAELRVGELDLRGRVPARELATSVALVYQDPGTTFSPALRMGSQLGEVLRTHRGLSRKEARERVLEGLRTVHLTDPERRLRQHPHELSGGMRQRAMIAAAMVNDPRLIIADEPTTALDVTVQAGILRELKRMNREAGTSMLFISHDIGVVEELCDRVLVMKDGEIVEELTWAQLAENDFQHPYTRKLVAATPRLDSPLNGPEDPDE
ncbi:ABC transporter ATP-binding protein [Nocardioides albidus]|uniref:ABC transporter ATP-binding protein n=1 Tax=Nocardioides albidus TaxID=1517589 RepID=UPI00195FC951|nr:ABC transporter ATP-binding protein [Nocardioides albidus]